MEHERIGILLVHGIGEHGRFEHLEAEARQIIAGLGLQAEVERLTVVPNATADGERGGAKESWRAEHDAPVRIELLLRTGRRVSVLLHEVWWADLDEPAGYGTWLRFFWWGLTQWLAPRQAASTHPGGRKMRYAEGMERPSWRTALKARLLLYLLGAVFGLVAVVVSLADFVLKRFQLSLGLRRLLVDYLGDVKLYQQPAGRGAASLGDLGQPPRVAIRRRLVRQLVDMALADYSRWYLFAHSLGSVVAFNGLMETAHCLPNYLDERRWRKCRERGIGGPSTHPSPAGSTTSMLPPRPVWLQDADVVHRHKLFERLRGFLSYGSPLEKFAFLWPRIAPLNKDEAVFAPEFQWVNVYDRTDPVADPLRRYDPTPGAGPRSARPLNCGYKAGCVPLQSHIQYLNSRAAGALADRVGQWLLSGRFVPPTPGTGAWTSPVQDGVRQYGILAPATAALFVLLALVPALALHWLFGAPAADAATAAPSVWWPLIRFAAFCWAALRDWWPWVVGVSVLAPLLAGLVQGLRRPPAPADAPAEASAGRALTGPASTSGRRAST